ncbi:MAG: hypothetical protein WC682_00190 [Parcubacteria group bacterium]|jgi:hypothetical protein
MKKEIFDAKGRIKREFSGNVIVYLSSLTKQGNQKGVGDAFEISSGSVSQMKVEAGRMYIGRKHLEKFAQKIGVSIEELIEDITNNLFLSPTQECPRKNNKRNKCNKHEVWNIALVDREPFLASLKKSIGGFDVESSFIMELNKNPIWVGINNVAKFDQTGLFPSWWLGLIKDKEVRQRVVSCFQCCLKNNVR